jgi:hypothetical protein
LEYILGFVYRRHIWHKWYKRNWRHKWIIRKLWTSWYKWKLRKLWIEWYIWFKWCGGGVWNIRK